MNEICFEKLKEMNVDVDGTVSRFMGNTALFVKFIERFPNNNKMDKLKTALADKNYEEVLTEAHSLKGETGNLGITPLFTAFSAMVADVRANDYSRLDGQFENAEKYYHELCKVLETAE